MKLVKTKKLKAGQTKFKTAGLVWMLRGPHEILFRAACSSPLVYTNGGRTEARRHILCGSSRWIAIYQIDRELLFINVLTQVREVSCQQWVTL